MVNFNIRRCATNESYDAINEGIARAFFNAIGYSTNELTSIVTRFNVPVVTDAPNEGALIAPNGFMVRFLSPSPTFLNEASIVNGEHVAANPENFAHVATTATEGYYVAN